MAIVSITIRQAISRSVFKAPPKTHILDLLIVNCFLIGCCFAFNLLKDYYCFIVNFFTWIILCKALWEVTSKGAV